VEVDQHDAMMKNNKLFLLQNLVMIFFDDILFFDDE